MKGLLLALMLLASPLAAQDAGDPYALLDRMPPPEGDMAPIFVHLSEGIREGRKLGFPHPDWGLIFAMLADFYRNDRSNAAYALRMADEGLEIAAPWGEESAIVTSILNSSRAYALADLGRYPEAVSSAVLAMPEYRKWLGDEMADSFQAEIDAWSQGTATEANYNVLELARIALVEAGEAVDAGEHGRGLSLAARAILPEDTGLDTEEVRRLASEAGMIMGRALFSLGRTPEALEVLRRAAESAIDREATVDPNAPVWRQDLGVGQNRIANLFFFYGRAAMDLGLYEEAGWAYDVSAATSTTVEMDISITFGKVRLMQLQGDEAGSRDVLAASARAARARGDEASALRAEFYMAISLAREVGDDASLRGLAEATERAAAALESDQDVNRSFYLTEAAHFLVNKSASNRIALDFARRALEVRLTMLDKSGDAEIGTEGIARETSALVATFLLAANLEASILPGAKCSHEALAACVILLENP